MKPYITLLIVAAALLVVISLTQCTGKQGPVGASGETGASGTTGAVGPQGEPGAPGTPGTLATPVQLCAGYTTTYPSVFAESALCINEKLYGVYDGGANDVFLSELPPGAYSSTSNSAPCNFTVGDACTVTH